MFLCVLLKLLFFFDNQLEVIHRRIVVCDVSIFGKSHDAYIEFIVLHLPVVDAVLIDVFGVDKNVIHEK